MPWATSVLGSLNRELAGLPPCRVKLTRELPHRRGQLVRVEFTLAKRACLQTRKGHLGAAAVIVIW